jgi:hypothetical protein
MTTLTRLPSPRELPAGVRAYLTGPDWPAICAAWELLTENGFVVFLAEALLHAPEAVGTPLLPLLLVECASEEFSVARACDLVVFAGEDPGPTDRIFAAFVNKPIMTIAEALAVA